MQKWIVLVGPPAVGKSTLSLELQSILNAKIYSFDQEFPKQDITHSSKDSRRLFLEIILADNHECILIDDTCHFRSMQKRYILALESRENRFKIIFLYLSARNDQISELKIRNSMRVTVVTDEEIDRMTRFLNLSKIEFPNVIEYNFKNIPCREKVAEAIKQVFDNYKERTARRSSERVVDIQNNCNHFFQLNLELNKKISETFKSNPNLDGNRISLYKKDFLKSVPKAKDTEIEDLIETFCENYLF